ncbi:STAS domain-containing protein [Actinomycetospora soli]|uniref:STAS domain-containing protein n=1 Tax=Actinomycetospora soli TaxID=2893887 RepID=UPI001E4D9401|nr:STAS domain-containing protein [Actinomycetospora soli]MCD2186959.1 STAS domain-containing protein [Actinomycetospora soli]
MDGARPPEPVRATIGVDVRPRVVRVRMHGDLDAEAAPRLDRVLTEVIGQAAYRDRQPATRMTIDLEDVHLLAAAGMTVLLRAHEDAVRQGVDCLVCVSPRGRRALAMTGLDRTLLRDPRS